MKNKKIITGTLTALVVVSLLLVIPFAAKKMTFEKKNDVVYAEAIETKIESESTISQEEDEEIKESAIKALKEYLDVSLDASTHKSELEFNVTILDQKALDSMSEEERFKAPQIMKKGLITVYWGIPASIEGDNQYNEYYVVYFEKDSKKLLGVEAFQYTVDERIKNIDQLIGEEEAKTIADGYMLEQGFFEPTESKKLEHYMTAGFVSNFKIYDKTQIKDLYIVIYNDKINEEKSVHVMVDGLTKKVIGFTSDALVEITW